MPDNPLQSKRFRIGWGPISAVALTVAIYIASQIVGGILVSLYPVLRHWNYDQTKLWLEQSVVGQFAFVLTVEALTLWLLWLFLRYCRVKLQEIGLKKPRLRDIGYALAGFGVYFILYIIVIQLAKSIAPSINIEQKQQLGFSTATSGNLLWVVFISLVILPPITEEILVRGFLYSGLRSKLPKITAAIITSIMFAAAHLQAGSGQALLWVAALDTFTLSMVLVYLRDKTDSLWASIFLHMLKNGIAFTALFIFKAG
jgi:uncharacterized protein